MAEGISIVDRDNRLVVANEVLGRLLDLPNALRKPGTPVKDILRFAARRGDYGPHDGSELMVARLVEDRLASMQTGERHAFERATPGGGVVEIRGQRLPTGELVTSYIDISHLKAAEAAIIRAKEAAELANRAKTEFLATVSHELRTPLNAIIGFSEIIRDQAFGPQAGERYRGYASDVYESGVHLLNIINDILDIAKIEAGAVSLHVAAVDIGDTIKQALRLVRQRADDAALDITVDVPANLPKIEGDQRRLKQVFLNLVTNAVKFTPRGGRVTVTAHHDGKDLTVVVTDTGIGMSVADIKIALEPFRQIESYLSRSVEGTGLGLPLARSLVLLHHGSLVLESSLGKGTRAIVRLPLRQFRKVEGTS
jgi:signal transduction histidine kinase